MVSGQGKALCRVPGALNRIIPAYKAIQDIPGMLPSEDVRELFKAQRRIAVVPCSCRYRTTAVEEHCAHTAEEDQWHCLQVNRGADYAMAREAGRGIESG